MRCRLLTTTAVYCMVGELNCKTVYQYMLNFVPTESSLKMQSHANNYPMLFYTQNVAICFVGDGINGVVQNSLDEKHT